MKRKIFAVFSIFTALLFASCSGINTIEPDLEASVESESNEGKDNSNEAYIKLSVKQSGNRTALPVIDSLDQFTSFRLVGVINVTALDKTWTGSSGQSAYSKMISDSIAVQKNRSYYFTLTASLGSVTYQGTLQQRITEGENNLSFELVLKSLNEPPSSLTLYAPGSLSIIIEVPSSVRAADVEVKTLEGTVIYSSTDNSDFLDMYAPENSEYNLTSSTVAYINSSMHAGNYVATFTFYGDTAKTLKLGQWCEYAGIAWGLHSESEITIESEDELESVYSITLHPDSGTLSTTTPGSYTRFSSEIVLPTASQISRTGYHFDGWYDAESGGNRIETIPAGSVGNKNLYAHWSIINYTITVNYITSGSNHYGTVTIPQTATYGSQVSLSCAPYIGSKFDSISSEGITMEGSGLTRTFTMPDRNIIITAQFSPTHLGTKDSPDAVWDIIFNDGTATPYSSSLTLTQAQKEAAVAILYYHEDDENYIYGVALKHNNTYFCAPGTEYYGLHGDLSPHDGQYNSYMITESDDYSAANYPSIWWAKHYREYNENVGNTAGDINGPYYYNWHIPSLGELRDIYNNKATLSAIINLIGSPYADPLTPAGNSIYATTSQSGDNDNYLVYKDLNSGSEIHGAKNMQTNALLIRKFTPVNGVSN